MRAATGILAAAVLAIAAAAGEPAPPRAPERLSETGLDHGADPFAPQYPLWTDGAAKSRWIQIPRGATIDVRDPDAWGFPVGTKLWKEFAFQGRKVETRLIWKATERDWVFAAYVWNDEQTEATLAPDTGIPGHVEIVPGKRHSIPGLVDCRSCHESGRGPVLGFNALQLSDDRDPLAPHAEPRRPESLTLRRLIEQGRLDPPRAEWIASPPRIEASSPTERAALGYLAGNCGHCHNQGGALAHLGLVLAHDVGEGLEDQRRETSLLQPGRFVVPGTAEGVSRRVAPGDPAASALLYRMRSRRPSSQMPPVGTVLPDREALVLIERWIESLDDPRR